MQYVSLTEYKKADPTTPSILSVGLPGDKEKPPCIKQVQGGARKRASRIRGGRSMDETLSEAGEEMEVENTPDQGAVERDFTTQELLQDLSGDD